MKICARMAGIVFGAMMLALSFAIAAETLLRKFFAHSFGGIDELGGYAVAVAGPLAFAVAAVEQAHIRINLLHGRLPRVARGVLNAVAAVSLALLALFLLYFTVRTVEETQLYQSIAQTPWATPLIYPQAVWLLAMGFFAVVAVILAVQAVRHLARRDWAELDRRFGPGSPADELQAELADLHKRQESLP